MVPDDELISMAKKSAESKGDRKFHFDIMELHQAFFVGVQHSTELARALVVMCSALRNCARLNLHRNACCTCRRHIDKNCTCPKLGIYARVWQTHACLPAWVDICGSPWKQWRCADRASGVRSARAFRRASPRVAVLASVVHSFYAVMALYVAPIVRCNRHVVAELRVAYACSAKRALRRLRAW